LNPSTSPLHFLSCQRDFNSLPLTLGRGSLAKLFALLLESSEAFAHRSKVVSSSSYALSLPFAGVLLPGGPRYAIKQLSSLVLPSDSFPVGFYGPPAANGILGRRRRDAGKVLPSDPIALSLQHTP